jgi:hypothetical protein
LQLNGTIKGDFEIKRVRMHGENNLREAICVLETRVRKQDGAKIWGNDFMAVCFSGLREGDDGVSWAYRGMKPSLVCEVHRMELNGLSLEVQPEITKIKTVEDEPAIIVPLRIRIDVTSEKIGGKLMMAVDEVTSLVFDAKQLAVPGSNANAPAVRTRPGKHGNLEPVRA